LYIYYK